MPNFRRAFVVVAGWRWLGEADYASLIRPTGSAERRSGRHGAKDHSASEDRLQKGGLSRPPRHGGVDFECDTDAQQQRQGDDIGEIQRKPKDDA